MTRLARGIAFGVAISLPLWGALVWMSGAIGAACPAGAAVGGDPIAVSRLLDEVHMVTGAPTRTHEQRVDLLLHVRARIGDALLAPCGEGSAP